jgi:hypothetical protein
MMVSTRRTHGYSCAAVRAQSIFGQSHRVRAFAVLLALTAAFFAAGVQAAMVPLDSITQITGPTVDFNVNGLAAAQTAPIGVSLFPSNSFANTGGISGLFTGNADAPIGPPSALSLGGTPGIATYFHFSPLPDYRIHAIGIAATGGFTNQATTFHVLAVDSELNLLEYDATMTPTGAGVQGLNGGAVFLGVESTLPILAFRVWQLDDGFGVLDNLKVDVELVPEPATASLGH